MDMYELYDEKIHEYQTSNDINHKIIKKMLDEDYIPTTPDIEKAFFINIMSFYTVLEYCYHNILKDCDAAQKYYDRSKKTGYDFAIYHQIISDIR